MTHLKRPIDNSDPQIWRLKYTSVGYVRAYSLERKAIVFYTQEKILLDIPGISEVFSDGRRPIERCYKHKTRIHYIISQAKKIEQRVKLRSIMKRSMDGERIKLYVCVREVLLPYYDEVSTSLNGNIIVLDEM